MAAANRDRLLLTLATIRTQLHMMNTTRHDDETTVIVIELDRLLRLVLDNPSTAVPEDVVAEAEWAELRIRVEVSNALRRRLR